MRLGDLGETPEEQRAVGLRFSCYVDSRDPAPEVCYPWTGGTKPYRNGARYPRFTVQGRDILAHRVAVILADGEVPDDMMVCRQDGCHPLCVRREHLFCLPGRRATHGATGGRSGERHPNARLTTARVVELRRRVVEGDEALVAVAREMGIATRTAQAIVSGHRWVRAGGPIRHSLARKAPVAA